MDTSSGSGNILITGGTSGLGLELVKIYLKNGYNVVALGRQHIEIEGFDGKLHLFKIDFSDLNQSASIIKRITDSFRFDIIINNAGILSPPRYTLTSDGFEYSFQVNFLAHLMINEIIINRQKNSGPLMITSVTSPIYKLARTETSASAKDRKYKPLSAYAESKYYLTLMCGHFTMKYSSPGMLFNSFNPGTFRSGIYRLQGNIFRSLYRVAAPFMRKPSRVAEILFGILASPDITGGVVYNLKKRFVSLPGPEPSLANAFWKDCYEKIAHYII